MAETPEATQQSISLDLVKFAPALNNLPQLQQRYILARIRGFGPSPAARLAGYADPGSASCRNEQNPAVRLVLDAMTKAATHELQLERRDVIDGLMDAVRMAATSTELAGAWREIAKVIGAYEPVKVEHTHRNLTHEKLAAMTDAQLAELADDPAYATLEGEFEVVPKVPTTAGEQDAPAATVPPTDEATRYGDAPLEATQAAPLGEEGTDAVLATLAYEDEETDPT